MVADVVPRGHSMKLRPLTPPLLIPGSAMLLGSSSPTLTEVAGAAAPLPFCCPCAPGLDSPPRRSLLVGPSGAGQRGRCRLACLPSLWVGTERHAGTTADTVAACHRQPAADADRHAQRAAQGGPPASSACRRRRRAQQRRAAGPPEFGPRAGAEQPVKN